VALHAATANKMPARKAERNKSEGNERSKRVEGGIVGTRSMAPRLA
jgi:hypothetical protein